MASTSSRFARPTSSSMPRLAPIDAYLGIEADELLDAEVGVDRRLPLADEVRLVRLVAVEGEAILLGVDGDRLDPQLGAGAEDPDRDLAAIRGHDSLERDGHERLQERSSTPPVARGGPGFDVVRCWPPFARGRERRKRGTGRA